LEDGERQRQSGSLIYNNATAAEQARETLTDLC
jgi:hypothetical protein